MKAQGTEIYIVSTYDPTYGRTSWGYGHDVETPGPINPGLKITISGGLSDFENLLRRFVLKNGIQRGERVQVTISYDSNYPLNRKSTEPCPT